jgi:hypothetical protein
MIETIGFIAFAALLVFLIEWRDDRESPKAHQRNEALRRRRAGQPFVPHARITDPRHRFSWSSEEYERISRKSKERDA